MGVTVMNRYPRKLVFRPHHRPPAAFLPLLVSAILSVSFFRYLSWQLRPMIETIAVSKTINYISQTVHRTTDDCLTLEQLSYKDFIDVETEESGSITSLSINPGESTRFRRLVTENVIARLGSIEPEVLEIPLGTLSGFMLLSAVGPNIRVRIESIGDVSGNYTNEFSSVGVNQTRHSVYLDLTVTVYLFIPGGIIPVTSTERTCIAETVIVGKVPDTYLNLQQKGDL